MLLIVNSYSKKTGAFFFFLTCSISSKLKMGSKSILKYNSLEIYAPNDYSSRQVYFLLRKSLLLLRLG